ncbi:peptidase U32 family protein [Amedibacillus dolichus]|uniref:peptidase U32 family protein n=1 Tax=Amedibacillus dolichus TaxID=31971 RepID=UPI00241F1B64|nr:U32 family peptidase [Amedibacillus dolichus]
MEFIVTPFHVEDITRLHEANADGVVVATPFFSARGAAVFTLEELVQLRSLTTAMNMKLYVLVNRFFMENELEKLREHLRYLKKLAVDGIYYGDESVLYEAKKLEMEHLLIYSPDTLTTSSQDVQYYLDEGISMVTISKDITLEETCHIAKQVKGECEVILHGRLNIMHSKRRLLSNYFDFLGKKVDVFNKKDIYLMEETRDEHMPIVEDDLGTHVFSGYTLVSFEEIKQLAQSGIRHVRIDGIFHDLDYVCKALSLYQAVLSNEMSGAQAKEKFDKCYPDDHATSGFYYVKTSKVK